MKKLLLPLLLAFAMLLGLSPALAAGVEGADPAASPDPAEPAPTEEAAPTSQRFTITFTDVTETAWHYKPIMRLAQLGLVGGVTDTTYEPDSPMTRGMLVTVLYRMDNKPQVASEDLFDDVEDGAWFQESAAWAYENGISAGPVERTFEPDKNITREELALTIWNYARYKGYRVASDGTVMPDFVDRGLISEGAGEAICWAWRTGLLQGKGENTLDPQGGATRAETAAILDRFMSLPTGSGDLTI